MAALPTALRELAEQAAFRIYVTDALYAMGNHKCLTQRYAELINPREVDTRTGQEIADDLFRKMGFEV